MSGKRSALLPDPEWLRPTAEQWPRTERFLDWAAVRRLAGEPASAEER